MNLNAYREYRFSHGILTATKTGNAYHFQISQNDRFYDYMKEHIIAGKVKGLTDIKIDELNVTDPAKTFFTEQAFNLNAIILATNADNITTAYTVTIKSVKIIPNSVSKKEYDQNCWKLNLYELEIPWHTEIFTAEAEE